MSPGLVDAVTRWRALPEEDRRFVLTGLKHVLVTVVGERQKAVARALDVLMWAREDDAHDPPGAAATPAEPTVLATYCAVCAGNAVVQRQVLTPSGVTCAQGHGGADGVSYEDAVARGLLANSREPGQTEASVPKLGGPGGG